MGMYDSIIQEVKCPHCSKKSQMDFQTKSGLKCLQHYKLGEKFEFGQEALKSEIGNLKYHSKPKYLIGVLAHCIRCEAQISGCIWVNRKSFILEELVLYSYTVPIKPEMVIKR